MHLLAETNGFLQLFQFYSDFFEQGALMGGIVRPDDLFNVHQEVKSSLIDGKIFILRQESIPQKRSKSADANHAGQSIPTFGDAG